MQKNYAPMMNILNGGSHADSAVDVQNLWFNGWSERFNEAMRMGKWNFPSSWKIIKANGDSTNVGNEIGYAPVKIQGTEGALALTTNSKSCEFMN